MMGGTRTRWQTVAVAFSMVLALVVITPHDVARAATLVVDNAGPCSDEDPSPNYCTIGAAIGAASPLDTVRIEPGSYLESPTLIDKPLNILGAGLRANDVVVTADGPGSLFEIEPGVNVLFRSLQLSGASGASVGGAILNYGNSDLVSVEISGNSAINNGSAVSNQAGTTRLIGSLVVGNSAQSTGSALQNVGGATLVISNSTIANNTSTVVGSAINNNVGGSMQINNATIVGNSGFSPVIAGDSSGVSVSNTILSNNTPSDCGAGSSGGYNLIESNGGCSTVATDILGSDPALGPLADNGGQTNSFLPNPGSLAIDAGNSVGAPPGCFTTDQRNVTRPQGSSCDIGAVEVVQATNTPPALTVPANQVNLVGDEVSLQLVATDADEDDLTFSVDGLPESLTASPDGLITGTVTQNLGLPGNLVTVTVDDGTTVVFDSFGWATLGNTSLVNDDDVVTARDTPAALDLFANDAQGSFVIAAIEIPEGFQGSVDCSLGPAGCEFVPPEGFTGLQTFSYILADNGLGDRAFVTVDTREQFGGLGTASIDGTISPGEWDDAASFAVTVTDESIEAPGRVLLMNDAVNLYLALELSEDLDFSDASLEVRFDEDGSGAFGDLGNDEDALRLLRFFDGEFTSDEFVDGVYGNFEGIFFQPDSAFESSEDGAGAIDPSGTVFELAHPYNNDSLYDLGLDPGDVVAFQLELGLEAEGVTIIPPDSTLLWEMVPEQDGTLAVTGVAADTSSVEAGYAVPLAAIPAERLLVGADSIAGAPLGAIGDLSASPLGAIPLGAIPLGAIGGTSALGQTLLSEIPITGGWEALLEGTEFAGRPLQTLTLDEVSPALDPVELAALGLGDIRIGDSALADLSIAALTLGDVPLSEMGLTETDSVLDIETSGGSIAAVPLGAIQLGAIPLGAIGSPPTGAPLGAIPLGAIQLGAIPLGAIDSPVGTPLGAIGDLAAAPLGAISPDGAPLGAIPLGAIQLGAIPLGAIQLGAIPLGAIGGGCAAIGCPAGVDDDSTVTEYLTATGSDLDASPLGAIPLGAIRIGSLQLGAIDVATLPVGAIPLGAITASTPLGAISLIDLPLDAIGTDIPTVCSEVTSGTCDATTLLAEYAAGLPAGTQTLSATPLGAIELQDVPLGAIEFTSTGLNGVPLGAISIAGVQLGAILLDSIDLVNSPLGAILVADTPLGAICGSSDPGVTLVEAAALGSCAGVTLADLGAALAGYTLADVLDHLTFGFLGQIVELDSLTYGEIVVSILLAIDFPWEDLPLDEIETRDIACGFDRASGGCTVGDSATQPDIVLVDVDVDVTGGSANGDLIEVTIPEGWAYLPDSATSVYFDGESTALEPLPDPSQGESTLTFAGTVPQGQSTIRFAVAPGFEIGTGFAISADVVGGESPEASAGIAVTEGLEFGDVVATAQQVTADTLYVGYIRTSGDQDWWDIPAPAPGFRVAVYLSNLAGDVDTFVYRPESAPLGSDTNSRSIPLGTVPISDDEFDFDGTDTQSPEVLGDSVVEEPAGQVLGDSSTNRGTDDEYSEFFSRGRDAGGDYSIQVAGFQGATSESPYVLRVKYKTEVPTPTCTPRAGLPVDTDPLPPIPADVDTIFLVNWDRMEALHGPLGTLPTDLQAFASSTVGGVDVNGVVLPIGSIPGVDFTAWDANPCDPDAANTIVDAIVSFIQDVADGHPSLRHVTVVGSDEVVPFARLEDETIVANESTYTEGFSDNALYGSQFTRHYLSDSPLGDLDPVPWLDRFAYLPDLGVGRLVETPSQIADAIATFQANGGLLDPQTAATAGYDFLTDGAQQVKSALSGLTDVDPGGSLLTETWSRQQLADTAYGATAGPAADLISPNAHYDHYRALPAIGNLNQSETDLFTIDDVNALGANDLTRRVVLTVGCHSALNVPNLPTNDQPEDWAEVYSEFRAVYIGNTGYGYGDTVTVALSEQVMANVAFNLGNGQTLGQNLSQAKQDQFGKAGLYGVYDLKAIEEATLYGLPFWRVDLDGALPITSNGSDTGPVDVEPETGLLAAPFSKNPVFAQSSTPDGDFWTADEGTQFLHWRPIQPKTEIDATQDGLVATGVLLTDLETTDVPLGDPVFGRPNTSDLSGREPEIEFRDVIFPTSFASVGTSDLLNPERTGAPTTLQQRVNLLAGQYVGPLDIQRLFDQIDGSVYYSDDPAAVDWSAPSIATVDADVVGDQATFLVEADDPQSGVSRVVVLYRSDSDGTTSAWTSIDLIPIGANQWAGGGTFGSGVTPPLDYVVQVANGDGVVSVSTFKGEFHKAAVVPVGGNNPPSVGAISGPTGPVEINSTVSFSADVTDDGPAPLTAVWDFGDGSTAGSVVTGGSTSVDHVYTSPGVYRVQLVVVDGGGAVGQSIFEFAVVYDPNGGFVTGGGWIDSPPGAYVPDPSITGKANFGFVSKYKKGKSTPDGNTTFQFKAADLKFKSTEYEWMVIAGKKAQYKGSGTINGSGDYGFMLTAIDAALTPSTDVDLFRIKIWDKTTDEVIYDNQLGASDDADPTTAIGGGSIVIHEPTRGGRR